MPFDARFRHLFTAGKLMFPAVFPKLGKIQVCDSTLGLKKDADSAEATVAIVRLTEDFPQGWAIARDVVALNVAAVFTPKNPDDFIGDGDWMCEGNWWTRRDLAKSRPSIFGKQKDGSSTEEWCKAPVVRGLVFLDEHVSVWNHIFYGSSAADSVDFVPCDDGRCCNPVPPCCPHK